jgi:hypothetical protein
MAFLTYNSGADPGFLKREGGGGSRGSTYPATYSSRLANKINLTYNETIIYVENLDPPLILLLVDYTI